MSALDQLLKGDGHGAYRIVIWGNVSLAPRWLLSPSGSLALTRLPHLSLRSDLIPHPRSRLLIHTERQRVRPFS